MAFSTQLSMFLLLASVYIVNAQQLPGPPDVGGPDIRPHFVKGPIPAEKAGINVSYIIFNMNSSFAHRILPKPEGSRRSFYLVDEIISAFLPRWYGSE